MAKSYDIAVWNIQFYKVDKDGNELKNQDGSVKLFELNREHDCSFILDDTTHEDLEEVPNEQTI